MRTGGGHLSRPQRAEELLLHTHSCLHYFLYYAYIMSCICTKGQPLHIIISDETNSVLFMLETETTTLYQLESWSLQ